MASRKCTFVSLRKSGKKSDPSIHPSNFLLLELIQGEAGCQLIAGKTYKDRQQFTLEANRELPIRITLKRACVRTVGCLLSPHSLQVPGVPGENAGGGQSGIQTWNLCPTTMWHYQNSQ